MVSKEPSYNFAKRLEERFITLDDFRYENIDSITTDVNNLNTYNKEQISKYTNIYIDDVVSVKTYDDALDHKWTFLQADNYHELNYDIYNIAYLIEDNEFINTIKDTYLALYR